MGPTDHQYWNMFGHQRVVRFLQSALERNSIVSAYLFWGPAHVGKSLIAGRLLQRLQCHTPNGTDACDECLSCTAWNRMLHPDTSFLSDDGAAITIDAVRELQRQLARRPTLGRMTVALLERAERMTNEAANALLKTLEEPSADNVLVLTSDHPEQLPETLRSRCQQLECTVVDEEDILVAVGNIVESREQTLAITRLSFGRPGRALTLARDPLTFQEYQRDVDEFVKLLDLPLHERQASVQTLLGSDRKQTGTVAERMLQTWFLLVRDMLLLRLNLPERIIHTLTQEPLLIQARRFSLRHLSGLLATLQELIVWSKHRVNPQLLVENFLAHL